MKKKLYFIKYSAIILLACFLFNQQLFSQTITKDVKKETVTSKGTDKKAVNIPIVNTMQIPNMTASITAKGIAANAKKYNNINKSSTVVLNFEGLGDGTPIGNFYDGGGGTNYGIYFNPNTLSIISGNYGGTGNFDNNPSGHTVMFFLSGSASIMNNPAGFTTGFSFYYASAQSVTIYVYDGLNGTGNLLATQSFNATPLNQGGSGKAYDTWVTAGVNFSGVAKSISFSGAADYCAFDDVTFGSSTPGQPPAPIPTLSEWGLIIMGFVLLVLSIFFIRRRNMLIS